MSKLITLLCSFISAIIAFCIGVLYTNNVCYEENLNSASEKFTTQIKLAVQCLDSTTVDINQLASHIYTARLFSQDSQIESALNELWYSILENESTLDYHSSSIAGAISSLNYMKILECAENLDKNDLDIANIDWQDGQYFAVAFLGYSDKTQEYGQYIDEYFSDNHKQSEKVYSVDGDENYLIIPRYPDSKTKIFEYGYGENGFEVGEVTYEFSGNKHFTLKCNVSDLFSNVLIQAEYDGVIYNFSPRISLENGELAQLGGIYNLETIEN